MTKKLLSITALFIFGLSLTAFAQIKVGYMNTQTVMDQLPQRDSVETELNAYIEQRRQDLVQRSTEYQDAVAEYQSNKASMSQDEITKREQELTDMQASLDEFSQSIRRQIQDRRQELLSPILENIDKAIAAIAESEGLDFVLNQSTNSGNPLIFYASNNQINITDRVIERLTSN